MMEYSIEVEAVAETKQLVEMGFLIVSRQGCKSNNPRAEPVALNSPLKGGVSHNTGKPLQGYSQSFSLKSNVPWPD